MRSQWFFTLLLVIAILPVQAFDLGGLLKEAAKEPGNVAGKAPAPGRGLALPELAGLLEGTSVAEEVAIGREIAGRLLGAAPLVDDDRLQRYVNRVGAWVASQSGRDEIKWYFGVIESDDINAFAAPGGYILITKGLYGRLRSEAELAGVLAHEMGHVIRQHHLKILKQGRLIDMGGRLLQQQAGGDEKGRLIGRLIGSGAEILARGLDQNAEYEADRIGVVLAARAGYDAYGLPSVLQSIGHLGADDGVVSLLFKTHPHPEKRMQALEEAMEARAGQFEGGKSVAERLYPLGQGN